jgi:hypothetical protein
MTLVIACLFYELFDSKNMLAASDQMVSIGPKTIMKQALLEDGQLAFWSQGILCGMPAVVDAMGGDYLYPMSFPFNY